MNRFDTKTQSSPSTRSGGEERDYFVVDDLAHIPSAELRAIVGGLGPWLKIRLRRTLARTKFQPSYVIELRRMTRSKHIPKRMEKHFETLRLDLEHLSFTSNFDASLPAVGPYVTALMAMSRRDGDIHFVAQRVTRQEAGELIDESNFRFLSWLSDGGLLVTTTQTHLPRPRAGLDVLSVISDDPGLVLKKHRERIRKLQVENVPPAELFDRLDAENRNHAEDLLRRDIVRLATPAEVARIRTELRV